jgi:predicted  nucleic acid-binding Zn-ribbon protein
MLRPRFDGAFFFDMNADLERLIALQKVDSLTHDAERRLAEEPERQRAFDARLDAARQNVATAKERLAASQNARRAIEKEVALHQGRLSKFRDQLMAVKTNVEYQAVQKEIGFAQGEVRTLEDQVLERMLEADELGAAVKRAEAALAAETKGVDADRARLDSELADLKARREQLAGERAALLGSLDPALVAIYERVSKRRNGVAVAEARDGICTICHVRLRPQVFNNIRRNEEITQCDSCQRILYFLPSPAPPVERAPQ